MTIQNLKPTHDYFVYVRNQFCGKTNNPRMVTFLIGYGRQLWEPYDVISPTGKDVSQFLPF